MLVPTLLSALPVRLSALLSLDRSERGFVVESSPYFSAVHKARCTASNIRTPHLQLFSLWGLGGRRTRFRSSSALLVPSLLSVAPNLTVGLSLNWTVRKGVSTRALHLLFLRYIRLAARL